MAEFVLTKVRPVRTCSICASLYEAGTEQELHHEWGHPQLFDALPVHWQVVWVPVRIVIVRGGA